MSEETKKAYPMLPIGHWWTLRKRFRQSIPGTVTEGYLSTVLGMEAKSARANVLPYLKSMGIVDDEGKTTERAKQWRDDSRYAEVCKEILTEIYPEELRDAVTKASERHETESWFARTTGAGTAAVSRMTVLYLLLLEADPSKAPSEKAERIRPERRSEKHASKAVVSRVITSEPPPSLASAAHHHPSAPSAPPSSQFGGVHINLEIHISSDATPDQIEAIFASMARHIYKTA